MPAIQGLVTTPADTAIRFAQAQIGKPYRYGFTGPDYYDCSGLVQAAYKSAGISLPRTSEAMMGVGTPVKEADLQPGDLVFPDSGHVQLYVGNRQIIEAPRTGLNVRQVPMWGFLAARRVTTPGQNIFDTVTAPVGSVVTSSYNSVVSVLVNAFESLPGVKQVETLGMVLEKLSDKAFWQRVGIGATGVALILIGIGIAGRKPIGQAAVTAGKAAAL